MISLVWWIMLIDQGVLCNFVSDPISIPSLRNSLLLHFWSYCMEMVLVNEQYRVDINSMDQRYLLFRNIRSDLNLLLFRCFWACKAGYDKWLCTSHYELLKNKWYEWRPWSKALLLFSSLARYKFLKGSCFLDVYLTLGNPKINLSVILAIVSNVIKGGKRLLPWNRRIICLL